MPYVVTVAKIHLLEVELLVEPEQPDAEQFALGLAFALGLLLEPAYKNHFDNQHPSGQLLPTGPLGEQLEYEDAYIKLATGGGAPERFVRAVTVIDVEPWPWNYELPPPVATYRIEVTDVRWLQHLSVGQEFESYARCENGPFFDGMT